MSFYVRSRDAYFYFLLFTTTCRGLEAGILASMMNSIQQELTLSYTMEGVLAAAPDIGIVPAGLIAIWVFRHVSAYATCALSCLIIGCTALLAVFVPCSPTLILARAVGGLCFGLVAVHFPSWINRHGQEGRETMWLGIYNAAVLIGILLGYVVGGAAESTAFATWKDLYFVEACLMLVCGLLSLLFHPDLVQVGVMVSARKGQGTAAMTSDKRAEKEQLLSVESGPVPSGGTGDSPKVPTTAGAGGECERQVEGGAADLTIFDAMKIAVQSKLYLWVVASGSVTAGTIGFILYFVTQELDDLALTGHSHLVVAIIFVTSPIPGNLCGSWWLSKEGGYRNLPAAGKLLLAAIGCSGVFCLTLGMSAWLRIAPLYVASFYFYLFFGSAPAAAINGIAVSVLPGATIAGSGLQFSIQNAGKLIIPSVGGYLIDIIGGRVVLGFHVVLIACHVASIGVGYMAWREAKQAAEGAPLPNKKKAAAATGPI